MRRFTIQTTAEAKNALQEENKIALRVFHLARAMGKNGKFQFTQYLKRKLYVVFVVQI